MAEPKRPRSSQPKQKRLHPVNIRMSDLMLSEMRLHAAREQRTVSNLGGKIILEWLDANRHSLESESKSRGK
jgi:hypothetical protein